ncbi:MAG: LysM peptidoglycan-binding domain-containing protein, partial [Mycobacteriales bacterium]
GRLVVLVALVALLLTAFSLGRVGSHAATEAPVAVPLAQTTVHPGETLWAVAKRVAPGRDPRAVVQRIRELNHLDGADVLAGQQLLLPRAA